MKKSFPHKDELNDAYTRAEELSRMGATVEKAVNYLNAEFDFCFYAVKKTLWLSYVENSIEQRRSVGAFA